LNDGAFCVLLGAALSTTRYNRKLQKLHRAKIKNFFLNLPINRARFQNLKSSSKATNGRTSIKRMESVARNRRRTLCSHLQRHDFFERFVIGKNKMTSAKCSNW
jgi:hypothetical protein